MSLINDALKRAKQQQRNDPPPGTNLPPTRPVESGHPPSHFGLIILLIVLVIGAAGILIFAMYGHHSRSANAIVPTAVANTPVTPAPLPAPTALPATNVVTAPVPGTPAPAVAATTAVASAIVLPAKPAGPKLQGIFYDTVHPTAMVSGKSVHIGSVVLGYKVKAITATEVDLIAPDQTITNLMLSE